MVPWQERAGDSVDKARAAVESTQDALQQLYPYVQHHLFVNHNGARSRSNAELAEQFVRPYHVHNQLGDHYLELGKGPAKIMFDKPVLVLLRSIIGNVNLMMRASPDKGLKDGESRLAGQAQQPFINLSPQKLTSWCCMPGRLRVCEALMRDVCTPAKICIGPMVDGLIIHLTPYIDGLNSLSLPACTSFAATFRKLVYTCTHASQQQQQEQQQQQSLRHVEQAMFRVLFLMTSIATSVRSPNVHTLVQDNSGSGQHILQKASSMQPQSEPQQQLLGVLLTIAVQIRHWHVQQVGSHADSPLLEHDDAWLKLWKEEGQMFDGHLTRLINEVLSKQILLLPAAQVEIGKLLGQHALTHFHGRLLPGCCHLGCTNMSGVSEAALPTLLCSGCRRARYCSTACQKAAWLDGGHGSLCRKESS